MNTKKYWIERYKNGGNSGSGSYDELYIFKRDIINNIIKEKGIKSIIDLGPGDGNQIKELNIEKYIGIDIAYTSIQICKKKYKDDKNKTFYTWNDFKEHELHYDLTTSLDVLYHILEEDGFLKYLKNLFKFSNKYILIYSSDLEGHTQQHIHTRKFTNYIKKLFPNCKLIKKINQKYPKKSSADFYLYEK